MAESLDYFAKFERLMILPFLSTEKIRAYYNEEIIVTMPQGKTVRDLKWLSIWCITFKVGVPFNLIQSS